MTEISNPTVTITLRPFAYRVLSAWARQHTLSNEEACANIVYAFFANLGFATALLNPPHQ